MEEVNVHYYVCEHCGAKFDDRMECREHEKKHVEDFTDATPERLANYLKALAVAGKGYHIGQKTLGVPTESFVNAMNEAARRVLKAGAGK